MQCQFDEACETRKADTLQSRQSLVAVMAMKSRLDMSQLGWEVDLRCQSVETHCLSRPT